jgi:hypothetical protein
LVPLGPAVDWRPSASSKRRAPVSTISVIPAGEERVADDELTPMHPTSMALAAVVVTGPTVPEEAAAPKA